MGWTGLISGDQGTTLRSLAYLWYEVGFARVLMWLANPTGCHSFQPHVHLYLADRYSRLAAGYRHRSRFSAAYRLEQKAEQHFRLGGGDEPPPAVALAVAVNERRAAIDDDEYLDPTENEGAVLPFVPRKPSSLLRVDRR